jgi:hypothetical protein
MIPRPLLAKTATSARSASPGSLATRPTVATIPCVTTRLGGSDWLISSRRGTV